MITRVRHGKAQDNVVLTVWIPASLNDRLIELGEQHYGASKSAIVRHALAMFVKQFDADKA